MAGPLSSSPTPTTPGTLARLQAPRPDLHSFPPSFPRPLSPRPVPLPLPLPLHGVRCPTPWLQPPSSPIPNTGGFISHGRPQTSAFSPPPLTGWSFSQWPQMCRPHRCAGHTHTHTHSLSYGGSEVPHPQNQAMVGGSAFLLEALGRTHLLACPAPRYHLRALACGLLCLQSERGRVFPTCHLSRSASACHFQRPRDCTWLTQTAQPLSVSRSADNQT